MGWGGRGTLTLLECWAADLNTGRWLPWWMGKREAGVQMRNTQQTLVPDKGQDWLIDHSKT